MAQYTETPNQPIGAEVNVNLWNQIAGYDGNLQYLYEVALGLIENYYTYGYRTASSFITSFSQSYSLSTQERTDITSNNTQQFYNELAPANIKVRKNGVYLLYMKVLANNNAINTPRMAMKLWYSINGQEEYSTLTNHSVLNPTVGLLGRTTNPVYFTYLTTLNNEDLIIPKLQQYTTGLQARINTQSGDVSSSDTYINKSPYISTVYLGDVATETYPTNVFFYSPRTGINFGTSSNPFSLANDQWFNTTSVKPLQNYDITNPNSNTPNRWKVYDTNSSANVAPIFDNISYDFPKSVFRSLNSYAYTNQYFIIGFKNTNYNSDNIIGYEQNLFSTHQTDSENLIIGTPFTISISSEIVLGETKTYLWVRIINQISKIELINYDSQEELYIGIIYHKNFGGGNLSRFSIYINSSQSVLTKVSYSMYPGYNSYISTATVFSVGGEYFYTSSETNQKSFNSSIYFIGNWQISNYLNPNIRNEEISSLWNLLANTYNINYQFYDKIITNESGNFVTTDSFVFGDTAYFA